ncbi:MAK10-like protein [Tanacetum coccineum]
MSSEAGDGVTDTTWRRHNKDQDGVTRSHDGVRAYDPSHYLEYSLSWRDENLIRTLGDYSKPSHEGYKNTIELPVRNNVVPLRSDTIRLVQNGCSFHGLRSEDPNQHLKDFLKLVDSLDLDGDNRERTRLHLFQFSLRDQASNWLERLPAGSITTWEDLTTRFLAQFFPPGRTAKLRNNILMFQQHHGEFLSEAWTYFKDLLQKVPYHGIDLWLQLRDLNAEESWALLEDLALYDNESWNDPRDFTKPVNAIALPQDISSTSDRRLIKLENQVQHLIEVYLAPTQTIQVNKVSSSYEEVEEILKEEEDDKDGKTFNLFPTMEELTHHEWLLKNPQPPWVKTRIRSESLNNIKISCMVSHLFKRHAYIDLESPINIMSRRQYNQIMTYGLRSRQKSSNPNKISNFVGRIRGLKVFIGSFAYECDFMILEDTTSIIDHHLGEMVFGRPFIDETSLVYNKEEGTVTFKQDDEKIMFKMPHTMKTFKQTRLMGLSTDSIPSFAYEENFGHGRTHYYQSLLIGDGYKHDEGDRIGIRHLIRLEKEMMDNKGEVT